MTSFPLVPLRFLSALPITNGLGEAAADGDESWPRYIRTTDISGLDRLDPAKRVTLPPHVAAAAPVLRDDILMTAAGSLGTAYHHASDEPACYAGYLVRWRIDPEKASPRFMAYWTQSKHHLDQIAVGAVRSTIDNFSASKFRAMQAPAPPLDQQRAIADFLDRETTQIDAMVDAQERLVALLEERRAAAITRAVTLGLNEAAELNDSGVDWLGRVPSHWDVQRLGRLGRSTIGLTYRPEDIVDGADTGTLVLRASNIQNGRISLEDSVYVSSEIPPALRLRAGDLLICARNGSARLVGKNARIPRDLEGQTWGAFMTVFRSPINEFVGWVLNSSIFQQQIGLFSTSTINQLTAGTLHSFKVALPPEEEQQQIISFLERTTTRIDAMISKAQESIALMKERRAALISAAVTGRIDVRTGIEQVERDLEEARA